MRRQRIHIHARRFRGIAQSFILRLSIHVKTLKSRTESMKRFAVRFHDDREFQPQADCLSWLSDRAFRCCSSHALGLLLQVFMIYTLRLLVVNKSPQPRSAIVTFESRLASCGKSDRVHRKSDLAGFHLCNLTSNLCPLRISPPPASPGPNNHKTRAPTSAHTTPPSPSASAAEAKQTAAP